MHSVVRVLAVAGLAAVGFSCADQSVSGLKSKLALLPIAPVFATAPDGGPDIDVRTVRGVLKNANGTDSAVAEAIVQGDSAILEFLRVTVTGDSTPYTLGVQAFDQNDVVIFQGTQTIQVKPGENPPAAPTMNYVAPDTAAKSLEIRIGTTSASAANLQWQGAIAGNTSCLNRIPATNPTTQVQLSIVGKTQTGTDVPGVRVGWTSLDPAVATVDDNGLVKSRCANKSTSVIARTFTDRADTIAINVTAPAFTLKMSPEAASVQRGATKQLDARVIDELGNESSATGLTWTTSDASKATVSATGLVTAIRNGRVQITATSGERTTVGIVDVVRPTAASVKVIPQKDTAGVNMIRQFVAVAFDAANKVIADAAEFVWTSSNTSVATIDAKGAATAKTQVEQEATLTATIDGKSGTGTLRVVSALQPGILKGIVNNGSNDTPISGASVAVEGGTPVLTDASGRFQLGNVQQGNNITVSATGFISITFYDAPAFPNQTIYVDDIPLPPAGGTGGTISGKVINALNAQGVSGITVTAYSGLNAAPSPRRPTVTSVGSTTTNSSGVYSFSTLAPGAYTFVASGAGYSQSVGIGIVIGGQSRNTGDIILPPVAPGSGLYAVLTWRGPGTNVPADLDLHITGPSSTTVETERFQVYSGNRSFVLSTDTVATIDVVDNTGPGAEVGSLRPGGIPGMYRFYVKNVGGVAGSKALADSSDARVDIFQDNRVVATFLAPAGVAGTVWEVFRFDGARIIPTNVMSSPGDQTVLPRAITEKPFLGTTTRRQ
jgi:hypothetical protein